MLEDVDEVLGMMRIEEEPPVDDETNLSRHLLNLRVLLTSEFLKLYTTQSSTSTTNCFAPMFKQKLDICMLKSDNHLKHFGETLTN